MPVRKGLMPAPTSVVFLQARRVPWGAVKSTAYGLSVRSPISAGSSGEESLKAQCTSSYQNKQTFQVVFSNSSYTKTALSSFSQYYSNLRAFWQDYLKFGKMEFWPAWWHHASFQFSPPHSDHSWTVFAKFLLEKLIFAKKLFWLFFTILTENNHSNVLNCYPEVIWYLEKNGSIRPKWFIEKIEILLAFQKNCPFCPHAS